MPVVSFPPEVMSSLLSSLDVQPSTLSPFSFLPEQWGPRPLPSHQDWLEEHALLSEQGVLKTTWKNALMMAAQPSHHLAITEKQGEDQSVLSHLLDGRSVIVATFNESDCLLSTSIAVEDFIRGLLQRLPVSDDESTPPQPWMTEHQVLLLLGALVNEGLGSAPEHLRRKVLFASVPRSLRKLPRASDTEKKQTEGLDVSRVEEVLEQIVGDETLAKALVMDLMADNILLVEDESCWIHPLIEPWALAIGDGHQLEWKLATLSQEGQQVSPEKEQRIVFFGNESSGCVAFPASEEGYVVFARPHVKELYSLLLSFLRGAQNTRQSLAGFGGGVIRG